MRKRWANVVLVSLLLGVVANIALAWSLAVAIGVPRWGGSGFGFLAQPARECWSAPVPKSWPTAPQSWTRAEWWCCTTYDENAEWPAPLVGPDGIRTEEGMRIWMTAKALALHSREWGWPMRSLRSSRTHESRAASSVMPAVPLGGTSLREGLKLPASLTRPPWATHLPLMPIWPGFAINTLLCGLLAGAVLVGQGVLRRRLRRRRGQCLTCGYELAGLAMCPECGAAARK